MDFFRRSLVFLCIHLLFLGCESKKTYNIADDAIIKDLNVRIQELSEDYNQIDEELEEVKKVLKDPDIDAGVRNSIRREVHEGEMHLKTIDQWVSYLKVRRKQRHSNLMARKDDEKLAEEAEKDAKAYFQQKDLKPIDKVWKNRYRTAIEL